MQFVNDDMDDELYRRAAEEYPLKTDGADWNKLREKLEAADGGKFREKRNKRGIVLLLALIPLVLICTTYITTDRSITDLGHGDQNKVNNQAAPKSGVPGSPRERDLAIIPSKEENEINELGIEEENPFSVEKTVADNHLDELQNGEQNDHAPKKSERKVFQMKEDDRMNNPVYDNGGEISEKILDVDQPKFGEQQRDLSNNTIVQPNNDVSSRNDTKTPTIDNEKIVKQDAAKQSSLQPAAEEKPQQKRQRKFYLGVLAGPDFSMVKSTNTSKAGYNIGLIAGYNLNKKFAVETGLLWNQKKYTSDGEYFNTEKLNWPHVTILNLSGYCNMFELPLTVRYNVVSNSKTTWFANAGISSYLMKKENYDYRYQRYGVYGYGNKEYKNTTSNWFSIAHVSVGIQKKIGTVADLRIEPYVKLPLNGVGIGSMPLRSTGIYLGITRPIR